MNPLDPHQDRLVHSTAMAVGAKNVGPMHLLKFSNGEPSARADLSACEAHERIARCAIVVEHDHERFDYQTNSRCLAMIESVSCKLDQDILNALALRTTPGALDAAALHDGSDAFVHDAPWEQFCQVEGQTRIG